MEEMLFNVTKYLDKFNILHWVSYGSLLGIIRDDMILPWTMDNDITLYKNLNSIAETEFAESLLNEAHLKYLRLGVGRVCVSDQHPVYKKYKQRPEDEQRIYEDHYPYVDIYESRATSTLKRFR